MTTSGSTNFNLVANQIIEKAFNRLGVASEGEAISARMYADGLESLNLMVKAWGAREHLWLRTEASVTLVASQASYALATLFLQKPMRVVEVRRRISGIDTPLTEYSRQTYTEQPNKSVASVPVAFYYDPQATTGTLYVWPAPSTATAASTTLQLTYLRKMQDFDNSNDDADLPQEWLDALIWNLADSLSTEYPVSDPRLAAKIEMKAATTLAAIDSFDTEPGSLFLQPEANWCNS